MDGVQPSSTPLLARGGGLDPPLTDTIYICKEVFLTIPAGPPPWSLMHMDVLHLALTFASINQLFLNSLSLFQAV